MDAGVDPILRFTGAWVATTGRGATKVVRRGRITEASLDGTKLVLSYRHETGYGRCEAESDPDGLLFEGRWQEGESSWRGTVSMVRTEPTNGNFGQFFGEFEGLGPSDEAASGVWILSIEAIE